MTAESAKNARSLYEAGAHYVIRSALLCAERLESLLSSYFTSCSNELKEIFEAFEIEDRQKTSTAPRKTFAGEWKVSVLMP